MFKLQRLALPQAIPVSGLRRSTSQPVCEWIALERFTERKDISGWARGAPFMAIAAMVLWDKVPRDDVVKSLFLLPTALLCSQGRGPNRGKLRTLVSRFDLSLIGFL